MSESINQYASGMKRRCGPSCAPRSSSANSRSKGLRGDGFMEGGVTAQGLAILASITLASIACTGLLAWSGSGETRLDLTAAEPKPLQFFMVVLMGRMTGESLYRAHSMRPKKIVAICFLVSAVLREPSCCELLLLGSSPRHQTYVPRCALHEPVEFV